MRKGERERRERRKEKRKVERLDLNQILPNLVTSKERIEVKRSQRKKTIFEESPP